MESELNFGDLCICSDSPQRNKEVCSGPIVVRHPHSMFQSANLFSTTRQGCSDSCPPLSAADFVQTREHIATGSWDNTARLYDMLTGAEISSLASHSHAITDLRCCPNAEVLLTSSRDGTFRIGVNTALFVPGFTENFKVLTCGADRMCCLWDIRNMACVQAWSTRVSSSVRRVAISQGKPFFSSAKENFVTAQPVDSGVESAGSAQMAKQSQTLTFDGNQNIIALPLDNREVKFVDMTGNRLGRLTRNTNHIHARTILCSTWAKEGKCNLFTAAFDNSVFGWDLSIG
ncbi:WD repeat-containing protein 37 [Cichlidogyrus casuarinus]|uniref:WD repeat-containing protein 37 n=1 Tax=Cichlidogyrus casuarinus TaxID=1844966 RepID=A0ABD2QBH2_9PLAT